MGVLKHTPWRKQVETHWYCDEGTDRDEHPMWEGGEHFEGDPDRYAQCGPQCNVGGWLASSDECLDVSND